MRTLHKHYINGEWRSPAKFVTRDLINPATCEKSGEVLVGNSDDVDAAVAAAKSAFESFGYTSREDRIEILENMAAEY